MQNLFVSVFVHECLMMLNDAEYTTFKMFVTQMSNYLFAISFQLMFYKALRYRLARALYGAYKKTYFSQVIFLWKVFCYRFNVLPEESAFSDFFK